MPELTQTATVSRSAFLELKRELQVVQDGYEFLDEKRILLAAELLRQRDAYRAARAEFATLCDAAARALPAAAADQGIDGLQVYPAIDLAAARLERRARQYVGQELLEAALELPESVPGWQPLRASPEVRACSKAFRDVVRAAAALAATAANLKRLVHEYRRTERRVRALENVVMPEIRRDLATMDEHLVLNEQEEVIRVRSLGGAAHGA